MIYSPRAAPSVNKLHIPLFSKNNPYLYLSNKIASTVTKPGRKKCHPGNSFALLFLCPVCNLLIIKCIL